MKARARIAGKAPRAAMPWGWGLLCGVVVTLATPTAALSAGLLTPSIAMALLDTEAGKPATRCMLLCGLAAAAAPFATLWTGGHTMDLAWSLLGDPRILILAWAAQGGGWLLVETLPLLFGVVRTVQANHRKASLRAERGRLEEEWGIASSGDVSALPAEDIAATPIALKGRT